MGTGRLDFNRGNLALDGLQIGDGGLLGKTVRMDAFRSINVDTATVETGSRLEISAGRSIISNLTNAGASMQPGNSPGALTIDGNFNFLAGL